MLTTKGKYGLRALAYLSSPEPGEKAWAMAIATAARWVHTENAGKSCPVSGCTAARAIKVSTIASPSAQRPKPDSTLMARPHPHQ
jgi:hypothetical protein